MNYVLETTTTNEYGSDSIDEVVHRVDVGGQVSPVWHRARWSEETREQHDADHKEPHDKHGLLHRVAVVGDNEPKR